MNCLLWREQPRFGNMDLMGDDVILPRKSLRTYNCRGRAAVRTKNAEQGRQVHLYGAFGKIENSGYLLVRLSLY